MLTYDFVIIWQISKIKESMAYFFDCQLQIEFVYIVEGHLMAISTKNNKLLSNDYWTMAISSARLLSYHYVRVVFKWL